MIPTNARMTKYFKNGAFRINGEPCILRNISDDGCVRYDLDENGVAYSSGDIIPVRLYSDLKEKRVAISDLEKTALTNDVVYDDVIVNAKQKLDEGDDMIVTDLLVEEEVTGKLEDIEVSEEDMPVTDLFAEQRKRLEF